MTQQEFLDLVDKESTNLPKDAVCRFLRENYDMSEQQAVDALEYLKRDIHVLAEFKHYIVTGSFVPDGCCYRVQGYSSEQLCRTTFLTPLGAFNYLIYLRERPEVALTNLKAGLPRR